MGIDRIAGLLTLTSGVLAAPLWAVGHAQSVPASSVSTSAEDPATRAQAENELGLGTPDLVIDRAELSTYGTSFYEAEEPLALRAGITFHATGDQASEDWVLVRGLPRDSSRNVLVLIDGMPINNAAYEGVELHDVPLSLVSRVEVYKPPLPARFGGYHAVINFVTRDPNRAHGVTAGVAIGSFNTQRGDIAGTSGVGQLWSTAGVSFLSSDNLSGVLRTPPVDNLRYEDRSYWDVAPTLLATYRLGPSTRLRLLSLFSRGRKAFSDDEYRNRWFWNTNLQVEHRLGETTTLRVNAFRGMEHYFLRLLMHPEVSRQDRVKQGGRATAEIRLPFHQALTLGGDFTRNELDEPGGVHAFHTFGAFVEDRFAPFPWLVLAGGIRLDGSDADSAEVNPSAEVIVTPWTGGSVFGRWSRTSRWPALGEAAVDHRLGGEVLRGFAAGISQRLWDDRLALRTTAFSLRLEGEVAIDMNHATYINDPVDSVSRGLELEASAHVTRGLKAFASYSLNQVRRDGDTESIAYGPPPHAAGAGVFYLGEQYSGRLSARYIGSKRGVYRHMGEATTVADSLVVDLYAARDIGTGLLAFVNVGNLFNLRYETFQGRPMFPRTVLAGLELRAP
ncbi:MAG: TonB-dependent receptor [Deltaproteobacteria bacterium]|nr:TonB-dependent receptor [Deltaproteobacteria bacterium]